MSAPASANISVESAFLKDELGPVLAKGLAAVAMAKPQDPVEYLALWLLHYQQQKQLKAQEIEEQRKIEADKEVWLKGRVLREKAAASVIQREWKSHTKSVAEAQQQEVALKQRFVQVEETAEEKVPEEHPSEGEKSDKERQAEADRLTAQTAFGRSRLYLQPLDKTVVAGLKRLPSPSNAAMELTLRCAFYLLGLRPRQVDTWAKITNALKPHPFCVAIQNFQPCGTPLEKKRKLVRVRRVMSTVDEGNARDCGSALFALYNWLSTMVAFRDARDEHIKVRRAAGKEVDEELDEDEEGEETEEKDPIEEKVKAAELEAKRIADAEAAAAEAEAAAEGAGATEE